VEIAVKELDTSEGRPFKAAHLYAPNVT